MERNVSGNYGSGFSEEPGGFWRRFAAFGIDGVLLVVFLYPMATLMATALAPLSTATEVIGGFTLNVLATLTLSSYSLTMTTASLLYFTFALAIWQTTIGKHMAGMTVVADDGSPVGGGRALARAVVKVASIISIIGIIITAIMVAARADKRGLNDVICGTKVVMR